MRMTEGERSLINPVDWNYPINHFNSKNYYTQESLFDEEEEDDDIDSYYMDLPPIDMTERLKEVNRALAEDATPIDSNRTTKLRFRDVIAEYQSPRDSDSDDGYGDSSEIMFDAEDENDLIYSAGTSGKAGTKILENSLELPEEIKISTVDKEEEDSKFQEVNFSTPAAATGVSVKSILAPSTKDEPSSSDEEIPEEEVEEVLEIKPLKLLGHIGLTEADEDSEKLFKLSSPIEFHNLPDMGDEDVFEVESEISEEIEVETNQGKEVDQPIDSSQNTEKPNKEFSVYIVDNVKSNVKDNETLTSLLENKVISNNRTLPLNLKQKPESESDEQTPSITSSTDSNKFKSDCSLQKVRHRKPISNDNIKTTKLKTTKIDESYQTKSNQIPTIKQSLSPYEISVAKDPKIKKNTPNSLGPNELRRNRSRLNAFHVSPTKTPSGAQVQSTRSNREKKARKGSPVPQRSSRFQEKKPVKAVHNQSLSNLNAFESSSTKKSNFSKPNMQQNGVRKAASTSDLRRSSSEDEESVNKMVYDNWLQQKNREAAISKRQIEEAKAIEKTAAMTKLEERKRLAEEAFQQWLRRKREQLRMERKMKMQQRKLDHQTTYAKTRVQCEEAYKEWCRRKSDETSARKAAGGSSTNVRSQSLERTWIQEKTRKLYSAYISK